METEKNLKELLNTLKNDLILHKDDKEAWESLILLLRSFNTNNTYFNEEFSNTLIQLLSKQTYIENIEVFPLYINSLKQ